MDSLQFDNYTSYSDASTPRTPSPRTSICSDELHTAYNSPHNFKPQVDIAIARNIFEHHPDDHTVVPEPHALEGAQMWSNSYSYPPPPGSRGSLLDELYDHDIPDQNIPHDVYVDQHHHPHHPSHHHSAEPAYHGGNWSNIPQTAHGDHIPPPMRHAHDVAMTRRATFPYVRHDRAEVLPYPPPSFMSDHDSINGSPFSSRPGTMYGEPLPMDGSPHLMMREPLHMDEPFAHSVHSMNSSPHHQMYDHHLDIKTEDTAPMIVPSQTSYCRPSSAGMHQLPCLSPHAGLLVQHTDDAASKETQYLRRRCFNCHTTEPPSWRRSTLNPGKIVCNKCGLYERTHLRPRPLRFDELRAGSKTRKQPKVNGGAPGAGLGVNLGGSPKAGKLTQLVKKEPGEGEDRPMIQRRSSVSSSAGSVNSGSGTSDWDDNVSVYSSGSNPPSSYNSPAVSTFNIPRDPNSQSPPLMPRDGGIRLPNAPLTDIAASLQSQTPSPHMDTSSPPTPRKAATVPGSYYQQQQQADAWRRGSLPVNSPQQKIQVMPEVTGWQSVPLSDLAPAPTSNGTKSRSNSLLNPIVGTA